MTGELALTFAVLANVVIALAYLGIGLWIAPRFTLTGSKSKMAKFAKLCGMAFFVSCAFTHIELAYHATEVGPTIALYGVGDWFTSWHGFLIHGVQASAGIGFLVLARRSLAVRIHDRSQFEDMIDEYLNELDALTPTGHVDPDSPDYRMWGEMIQEAVHAPHVMETMYQPIVNLATRERVGFEALTRFNGFPDYTTEQWFIAAERYGLQQHLEIAALLRAIDGIESFEFGSYLSLNVSQETFLSLELMEALASRPPAHRYVLELTEHMPVVRYKPLVDVSALVRHMGVRVAVDDLGSGFATMRRIIELQPELVKIDRSITSSVVDSEHQRALLRGLITYARDMGIIVVVEGIESEAQMQVLRDLGARFGQGYHLGRPAPVQAWRGKS